MMPPTIWEAKEESPKRLKSRSRNNLMAAGSACKLEKRLEYVECEVGKEGKAMGRLRLFRDSQTRITPFAVFQFQMKVGFSFFGCEVMFWQ